MKNIIILFIVLSALIPGATADFNTELGLYGFPKEAATTELNQVNNYKFMEPGAAIVQIEHVIPYGTVINEYYNFQSGIVINTRISCTHSLLTSTCIYNLTGGGQSDNITHSWLNLGILGTMTVSSSIEVNTNGTIFFGVGRYANYYDTFTETTAHLNFSALQSSPIISMSGTSSKNIDLSIQTLNIDSYSNFIGGVLNMEDREQQGAQTIAQVQNIVTGIVQMIVKVYDNPVLIFAYLEIFALMYALKAKNISQWWSNYISVHGAIINFILNNAQATIGSLIVVVTVSVLAKSLGLG